MNKPQHLAAASLGRFGLATAVVAGVAFAAQPTVSTNDVQKMEKFVVTGSLIPIAAGSPAIPVTVLGAPDQISPGIARVARLVDATARRISKGLKSELPS